MLHSQDRERSNSDFAPRTALTLTAVLGLLAISIMALTSGSLRLVAADSSRVNGSVERINHRVNVGGSVTVPKRTATSTKLFAALVSIDVDRTDDVASASACTAAANDCSLRGAVAFANLNPGTTINVPAGTYQLNIPGGV